MNFIMTKTKTMGKAISAKSATIPVRKNGRAITLRKSINIRLPAYPGSRRKTVLELASFLKYVASVVKRSPQRSFIQI